VHMGGRVTPLTGPEFSTIQRFCELMSDKLARLNMNVFVESDFYEFVRLRREIAPAAFLPSTWDPNYNDLSFHNSFWLRAVDHRGRIVATMAQRIFETDSFLDVIRSLRLWCTNGRRDVKGSFGALECPTAQSLSGRVGHSGGLWIDPDFRKKNVSGYLDHLSRGLLLKNYWFDHITAVIFEKLANKGIATRQYGWPRITGRFEFDLLLGGELFPIVFCDMSRAEVLRRVERWLLLPDAESAEELEKARELVAS
jgi:hypothetical protein